MNEGFSPFSGMAWIISITGWWECLLQATLKPSAEILTLLQRCTTKRASKNRSVYTSIRAAHFAAALLCAMAFVSAAQSQTQPPVKKPATPAATTKKPAAKKPAATSSKSAASKSAEAQLSVLALALRDKPTPVAEQHLMAFAELHSKDDLGSWAALALGHYSLDHNDPPEALKRFAAALHHPSRLDQYAMFWHAQTLRQLGHNDEALAELADLRHKFPDSVMSDLAVQSYAEEAIAQAEEKAAVTMLDGYANTSQKSVLLLLRAQAREKSGSAIAAAKDYVTIYYDFPLSDEARAAGQRIPALGRELADAFPSPSLAQQTSRAEALFTAHKWAEARQEFEATLPQIGGADRDHAELRVAQTHSSQGGGASSLVSIKFSDPAADAERLYSLSQALRSEKREPEMLDTVNQLAARYPQNHWTEEAFFATGNYYWTLHNRSLKRRELLLARRLQISFGRKKRSHRGRGRAIWMDYWERENRKAAAEMEAYIQKYPASGFLPDALDSGGRAAERGGNRG